MSSLSFSAIVTLDSALALLSESLENLKAAGSVEVAQLSEQLRLAAESAGKVRESVLSEMPEASPQSRQELDALVEKIRETLEARRVEQQRSRLLALAAELERGTIVHRRALRVSEVKQLREQAVTELRVHAQSEAPPTLPGPAAPQWVEWACGLQEPHDAECLQVLQSGFARLDHFVANLEPNTWRAAELTATENLPGADTSHDTKPSQPSNSDTSSLEEPVASSLPPQIETDAADAAESQRAEDQSPLRDLWLQRRPRAVATDALQEPSEEERQQIVARERAWLDSLMGRGREAARGVEQQSPLPDVLQKDPRGFESNTLMPHDATPSWGEEEDQQVTAQERALLDGMVELIHDPAGHFSAQGRGPITEVLSHATTAEPAPAIDPVPIHKSSIDLPVGTEIARETKTAGAAVATKALTPVERTPVAAVTRGSAAAVAVAAVPIDDVDPGVKASLIEFPSKATATPVAAELGSILILPATSTAPAIRETTANAVLRKRGILLLAAIALVLTALAVLLWRPWAAARRSDSNSAVATPVSIPEAKATSPAPGNTEAVATQLAIPANSATQITAANTPTKNKDVNREITPKPIAEASSAKRASGQSDQVLSPPAPSPASIISIPKQQAAVSSKGDAAIPVPSVLANGASSGMPAMVGNIPAAVPPITNQGRLRISSGVAQGLLIRQVNPRYPQRAIQDRIQGTVVLQAVIAKDGSVQDIRAVSGNAMLTPAAMDAVKQWRYKPYQLNGEPVEADTEINVKFKLGGE